MTCPSIMLLLALSPVPATAPSSSSSAAQRPVTAQAASALHWARFPVHALVGAPSAAQAEDAERALAGLEEWVSALHGKIRYIVATSAAEADITVRMT